MSNLEELIPNVERWSPTGQPIAPVKQFKGGNKKDKRRKCRNYCRNTSNCKSAYLSQNNKCNLFKEWDYHKGNIRTGGDGYLYTIDGFKTIDNKTSINTNNIIQTVDTSTLPKQSSRYFDTTNKPEVCRVMCNYNPVCVGSTLKGDMCTLYDRIDENDKMNDNDSVLFMNDRKHAWKSKYEINRNTDAPGNEIENKGKIEVQKCEEYCEKNPNCKGYTIDNDNCILKESWYNKKTQNGKTLYIKDTPGGNLKQNTGDSYMPTPNIQECNISISEDDDDELTELKACRDAANCYSTNILNNQEIINYNNHLTSLYTASYNEWVRRNEADAKKLEDWEHRQRLRAIELRNEVKKGKCPKKDWRRHGGKCYRRESAVDSELEIWQLTNPKPNFAEPVPDIKSYNLLATNDSAGVVQCCANTIGIHGNASDITQSCIQEVDNSIKLLEEEKQQTTSPAYVSTTIPVSIGTDTNDSNTSSSDTGGSATGGSAIDGSATGGSDTGGTDTDGSDTGGSVFDNSKPDNIIMIIWGILFLLMLLSSSLLFSGIIIFRKRK
jgi:hypothetical protein